jgi:hypothetical protein
MNLRVEKKESKKRKMKWTLKKRRRALLKFQTKKTLKNYLLIKNDLRRKKKSLRSNPHIKQLIKIKSKRNHKVN